MIRVFFAFALGVAILEGAAPCPAQTRSDGPSFEVASLKLSVKSNETVYRNEGGPGTKSPGQWLCTVVPLSVLVTQAWDLHVHQLSGPAAMETASYDIVAKVPSGASRADVRLMIQRLLIERLHLEVSHQRKEQNVQELAIAKGGVKLQPAAEAAAGGATEESALSWDKNGNPGAFHVGLPAGVVYGGRMQSMEDLIRTLESPVGQMIIDRTGLAGKYDYTLKFSPIMPRLFPLSSGATAPAAPDTLGPSLQAALVEQLGLSLQPAKAMVDILTVERFDKAPAEN
jgi:uncharacterized protein (TIGR03435 family)